MKPQTYLRASRTALCSRLTIDSPHDFSVMEASGFVVKALRPLIALPIVLLLLALGPMTLFAQQPGWVRSNPYGAQYVPSQQSTYGQPGYAQPYAQQSYPASGQAYPQDDYGQAQLPAQPLNAGQLEQLVAPIALYPDALVAQVLAAATYPAQVAGADHWRQAMGYASPGQIVDGADAQAWDPSVKALTAFPQVLAMMDRNLQWTTDLGNAYYNQPQDVLETVQVLRQRAQQAGTLQNTPQETVSYNQGYIELAPPNPQVVSVPAYNPWDVYGQPVSPYHGFSLLGALQSMTGSSQTGSSPIEWGLGTALSAFNRTNWGWLGWGLNWLSQSVLFNHSDYYSQSTSVAHWSAPHGGRRPVPERAAIPRGYNPEPGNYGRPFNGYGAPGQRFDRPTQEAYNRVPPPVNRPQPYAVRPEQAVRPGYGSGFANRPGDFYGAPMQSYRAPAPGSQRGDPGQRFSAPLRDRDYAKLSGKQEHSGGFHPFGGGHASAKSYGGGHAPKGFKNEHRSGGGHLGGGGHSGGHSIGHLFGFHHH
jgi:hypothetical protein